MTSVSMNATTDVAPAVPCLALRPREAAKALGISENILVRLTRNGTVPCIRIGDRIVMYTIDSLRDWLARNLDKTLDSYAPERGENEAGS